MHILVVGAGRGLGLHLAAEALKRGHKVAASCRTMTADLTDLKTEYGESLLTVKLDLREEGSIARAAVEIQDKLGYLNSIINNAGVLLGRNDSIRGIQSSDLEESFAVNLFGPMLIMKHCDSLLAKDQPGVVVNVSSESALDMGPRDFPYSLTKHALNAFSQKLQSHYAGTAVKVYAVHPGWMKTDMGGPNAPLDPRVSAERILNIVEGKTIPNSVFVESL